MRQAASHADACRILPQAAVAIDCRSSPRSADQGVRLPPRPARPRPRRGGSWCRATAPCCSRIGHFQPRCCDSMFAIGKSRSASLSGSRLAFLDRIEAVRVECRISVNIGHPVMECFEGPDCVDKPTAASRNAETGSVPLVGAAAVHGETRKRSCGPRCVGCRGAADNLLSATSRRRSCRP